MRRILVLLHRVFGLAIAGFVTVAGLTGAVISWDHELDEWLNPGLHHAPGRGEFLPPLEWAARVEAADPRARVAYIPLVGEPGEAAEVFVEPRIDPGTGRLHPLGYNQVFLDPVTGEILGRREWGRAALDRQHLLPFLYKLHYSLHIPAFAGTDRWGYWLMGGVALVWIVDCFVGLVLTLPRGGGGWARWRPAWMVRRHGGSFRLTFDLHRAAGLWLWLFLLVLAVSSASLNLYRELAQPLVAAVSSFTPTPFDLRKPNPPDRPIAATVGFSPIITAAAAEGMRRGWDEPPGSIYYVASHGIYALRFFHAGDDHGTAGIGPAVLYYDGADGRYLGDKLPWHGTGGDLFLQIQFPLHSGRIAGLPGRILISAAGIGVAMLSITGVVIWWRKRGARRRATQTAAIRP